MVGFIPDSKIVGWRRPVVIGLCLAMLISALSMACREAAPADADQEVLQNIFRSGLEMRPDPHVRAETLRVMEMTGDPELAAHAGEMINDPHPMVRMAALRSMILSEHPRARQRALMLYNRAGEAERIAIFEVSMESPSDTVRRAVIERAQRDEIDPLRLRAIEEGLVRRIEVAREEGDDEELRHELVPELGNYVDDDNPKIAALALKTLSELGRAQWALEFVDELADDSNTVEERIDAGRTLVFAQVEAAREIYEEILDDVGAFDPDSLGIPEQRIDERLLRLAVLGMTALGHPEFVDPAMRYLDDVGPQETMEVLQVLAQNPDEDASIALRTHMRDANAEIRRHAIALYGERDEARPDALIGALRHDDYVAQQMVMDVLARRFADEWLEYLSGRLYHDDPFTVERTLRSLQTVLRTDEQFATVLPLIERFEELARGENLGFAVNEEDEEQVQRLQAISNIASFLLFRASDDVDFEEIIEENPDPQTRYAYLEYLAMSEDPGEHASILKEYLYDDFYVLRLMAAAGLWRAYADQLSWPVHTDAEEDGEETE